MLDSWILFDYRALFRLACVQMNEIEITYGQARMIRRLADLRERKRDEQARRDAVRILSKLDRQWDWTK